MKKLVVYIPMDRRHAIAKGEILPDRMNGAALFADISGFTPLTEALVHELGPQRGAEELTNYLNLVYDAVIEELHRYGGSVIAFAGDAITCWLDQDDGLRATSCALAMQQAMTQFAEVQTPGGSIISLSMKAAVATGAARRFVVGDPEIRVLDALAGETLVRLAAAEHQANRGEVILDQMTLAQLDTALQIEEMRADPESDLRFGVVSALTEEFPAAPWPSLPLESMDGKEIQTWLLPSVYEQITRGLEEFLSELRPTVAFFLRFGGIDYDHDEAAGQKLDAYIRWVQSIVARYAGTFIDLNIGDKGSYIYINFGAPLAHENNAAHAALAALALRHPPAEFTYMDPVQMGISQGRMRAGVYGGTSHRTYGVLGDEVNMAARLMMKAGPNQILVSAAAQGSIADAFTFETLPAMRVKGKSLPVTVFALVGQQSLDMIRSSSYALPMVGRAAELRYMGQLLETTRLGNGQIITLMGEAGSGKSRLADEVMHQASAQGWNIYSGACESYGTNSSYLVWHPIWRGLLGVDPAASLEEQITTLTATLARLNPDWVQRLPLLDAVLQLAIPENDFTRSLDAKVRKTSLHSLLVDILRVETIARPTLIVLENGHWLDPLSYELLQAIYQSIVDCPVSIMLISRTLADDHLSALDELDYAHTTHVTQLYPDEAAQLVSLKLEQLSGNKLNVSDALMEQLVEQAQGNPFYLEEVTAYLYYQGFLEENARDNTKQLDLPDSLHRLVLSRLDQLSEGQKIATRVASVIGRVFQAAWLWGVYPQLGESTQVRADLDALLQRDLTVREPSEPELTYFFRQVLTQTVTYESLPYAMRSTIHDQIGQFIEAAYENTVDQYLDLLAYHYDNSDNDAKRRIYLLRAGQAAQAQYANLTAIDYYTRLLPLLSGKERIDVQLQLGRVLELTGQWQAAKVLYEEALGAAQALKDRKSEAWCETAMGELLHKQGDFDEAWAWLGRAHTKFEEVDDLAGVGQVLHYSGTMASQQGELERARQLYNQSLKIREQIGDRRQASYLLGNLGIVARRQGDPERAQTLYEQSLAIRRELGDRWGIANSLNNLGNLTMAQGDITMAREMLEEAVTIHRQLGDRWEIGNALNNLGNVVRSQGDYEEARTLYHESLTIYRTLGDKWALAYLLEDIGWLLALEGEDQGEAALRLVSGADVLREEIGAPLSAAEQEKLGAALAPALESFDEERQAEIVAAGKAMALAEMIEFALSQ